MGLEREAHVALLLGGLETGVSCWVGGSPAGRSAMQWADDEKWELFWQGAFVLSCSLSYFARIRPRSVHVSLYLVGRHRNFVSSHSAG